MKINKIKLGLLLLMVLMTGCAEGNFDLAEESRLPKWFKIPKGMTRQDVTITMDTYIVPTEKSIFKLWDKKGNKLAVVKGKRYGGYLEPKQLKNPPPNFPHPYASYEIIVVDGVVDIVEHRKMEPIFYMTDDPVVWNELGPKTKENK